MSPFYPPGQGNEAEPEPKPFFSSAEDLVRHQAQNLREALGEALWQWLEQEAAKRDDLNPNR